MRRVTTPRCTHVAAEPLPRMIRSNAEPGSDNTKNSATIKIINDDKAGVAIVHSGQRLPAFEGKGKPNSEYSISLLSQPTNPAGAHT